MAEEKRHTTTLRHKKLARNLMMEAIEHRWKTITELVVDAGYSLNNAKCNSKYIIAQPGVQEILDKLGFNELMAKARVSEILMTGNDNDALKAADMVFKVKGSYAPEKKQYTGLLGVLIKEIEDDDPPPIANEGTDG